jgi:SPP1 family predicted phage head-tail adaptor
MDFPHTITVQRATDGAIDDRGVPAQTWAELSRVRGWVQPKDARELAALSQGGPVASTHTIYLWPTDVTEADRIVFGSETYQIEGIRDEAGMGHHLRLDCRAVAGD